MKDDGRASREARQLGRAAYPVDGWMDGMDGSDEQAASKNV